MEVAFAVGAEVEAGADGFSALRAIVRQGLAHQEIDEEADEGPGREQDDNEQCPQSGVHAAAFGVAIHVADQENKDST